MNILFWNIKTKPENKKSILSKLIQDYSPDIFFLAESNKKFDLGNIDNNYIKIAFNNYKQNKPVTGFVKSDINIRVRDYYHDGRIAVCVMNKDNEEIAICGVHLRSKINDEFNQHYYGGDLRTEIFKICSNYEKVLFIGDFNLAPWDKLMCTHLGVNAIPWSSEMQIQNYILKNNVKHFYLYNPMWNYLGDEILGTNCGSKGSYKLERDGKLKWQFIDQVICSKELIPNVFPNKIKIIKEVSINNTIIDILEIDSNKKKNKYSDHYPILCSIK